ncbi:DUF2330 domain-containing protein [Streptomyces sp. NPDC049687]|uniref:DUF2330 domain-containing protein n=1 Tax=Streptomyces sp. NPDC049687 TaxID=3365596 RepID=UPI0037AD96F0
MVGLVGTIGVPRGRARRRERDGSWPIARALARVAAVLLALLAVQLDSLVAPAHACACGALVPGDQRQLTVGREVSVVRWDGRQEQIVMSLRVGGDAERAAWVVPVPHRATVELGDARLFDQLATATAPVQRTRSHFWPQDGDWPLTADDGARRPPPPQSGGAEVGVVGRERLGPFDVARLTATDPAALDDWLTSNDFTLPARLETALQPYVDQRWEYVAVRLAPETAGTALTGELDPLHLTFAADAPVYPMRLSRLAATPQSLGLYVLAAHRMEPASRIGGERPRVTFAGRIGTSAEGPLGELAAGTPFLTAVAQEFPRPWAISGDHELRRAAADTAFRQVIYEDRLLRVLDVPVWLLTVFGGLAALTTACVALALRARRARRAAQPGPRHASGHRPAPPATAPGPTPPASPATAPGPTPPAAAPGRSTPVVPAGRRAPVPPPVPTARPATTHVPPHRASRPAEAAVPPRPATTPAGSAVPPRPPTRPVTSATPPKPARPPKPATRPTPTATPPRPAAHPVRTAPPPRSATHPAGPAAAVPPRPAAPPPRSTPPVTPPRPLRPPVAPPRPSAPPPIPPTPAAPAAPAPPKPFTLPVAPRPNG